jgi:hypothetical protein
MIDSVAGDSTGVMLATQVSLGWLGPLLLGWGLGIVGTELMKRREQELKRDGFIQCAITELQEVGLLLADATDWIAKRYFKFDQAKAKWYHQYLLAYDGPKDITLTLSEAEKYSKWNDTQLKSRQIAWVVKYKQENKTLDIPPFEIPYIESNLELISLLDRNDQSRLFEIRSKIKWINRLLAENESKYQMLFSGTLDFENQRTIGEIRDDNLRQIARLAKDTVEGIRRFCQKLDKTDIPF